MAKGRVTRRELIAAGAVAGAASVAARPGAARAAETWSRQLDFAALGAGDGWPGWVCPGVANLRRADGRGLLEAGSDVFPCDPRPVAFALDQRFEDGDVSARVESGGAGVGLVVRRVGPRDYYAALLDDEQSALVLLRRSPGGAQELARASVLPPFGAFRLTLRVAGRNPAAIVAELAGEDGTTTTVTARDATAMLQRAGDPGVLATARTLFPSQGPAVLPALGNLHLLPYGVQEGQAFIESPLGEQLIAQIRERSTAVFAEIVVRATGVPRVTRPSVVAAGTGAPVTRGAMLRVATDVPARVEIEIALDPGFRGARRLRMGITNDFQSVLARAGGLPPGRRVYWRVRLRRRRRVTVGPARSFRVLPRAGSGQPVRVAIGSCAAQFGPIFDVLRAAEPDVFVWQGDLNYPDTLGPLSQTIPGYAGIWRDFLANPLLEPLLERTAFAAQRDDHDYGLQDANAQNLVPWGLAPWERLIERRPYYRFSAGLAEFWVLDQRLRKTDPAAPDGPGKTLLGAEQRAWLLRTLSASRARFKVVCSPCTLAPLSANARDGSWATGYTTERDLLLAHIREHVSGRTVFVTGDTHWTLVYDRDGLFEARPCPLGIPTPNDITLTQPQIAEDARGAAGVLYADDDRGHFALIDVAAAGDRAQLELKLVRDDGAVPFQRRFDESLRGRA